MSDDLHLEQIQCGPMQNFVYVLGSKSSREVALIDPAWQIDALLQHLAERDLEPVAALVTHYHPDHCGGEIFGQQIEGLPTLLERRALPVYVNRTDGDGLLRVTGLSESDLRRVDTDDTLRLGQVEIQFLHTPGHTPGSQCFLVRNALVSGDTLFVRGCGRVDLPGANPDDMYRSLKHLSELPGDVVLYPGHHYAEVPTSTIGQERDTNPYLRMPDLESWRELMGYAG